MSILKNIPKQRRKKYGEKGPELYLVQAHVERDLLMKAEWHMRTHFGPDGKSISRQSFIVAALKTFIKECERSAAKK